MLIKNILFAFIIISFFACTKKNTLKESLTAPDSTKSSITKINDIIIKLNPKAKELVRDWKEYQKIDEFIQQYREISTNDALLNSKELSELAQQLKDSIRIEKLNNSSVKIRLNVLYNETLRLSDMETISSINELEVIQENKDILNAYSALNMKINNISSQERLNREVVEFIEEITNSKDSLKLKNNLIEMDSIPIQ